MFLFSCAYACAYVACVMLIAQVGTRLKHPRSPNELIKLAVPTKRPAVKSKLAPRVLNVCMYVCKSLFIHGKSSVKLKLKTKTNYNCFT